MNRSLETGCSGCLAVAAEKSKVEVDYCCSCGSASSSVTNSVSLPFPEEALFFLLFGPNALCKQNDLSDPNNSTYVLNIDDLGEINGLGQSERVWLDEEQLDTSGGKLFQHFY